MWEETGRWEKFGGQLLKIKDRKGQEFCYGPTHEEVVTDFARNELKSYKQLPINFYQIQTKFRDEIRPRFGVMRAREFLMKDAYSFHLGQESLAETYAAMYQAYARIFTRLGLSFRAVQADTGAIGGNASHEFQVLADSGEDAIAFSDGSDYAANLEKAEALAPTAVRPAPAAALQRVDTPTQKTIDDVADFLKVSPQQCVKTLLVRGRDGLVALCLRGDHEINEVKAGKLAELPDEVGAGQRGGNSRRHRHPPRLHRPGRPARLDPGDRRPRRRAYSPTSSAAAMPIARIAPAPTGSATRASPVSPICATWSRATCRRTATACCTSPAASRSATCSSSAPSTPRR